ncbi:GntR family transcriptional regulator [Paramicrobacterium fandaimingii]|uniref:GntR family transcriptional regulator n=1 Tax=Paramicrobacterium fandaimingii TaxID=2708079 RepID=UPI001421A5BB|nr:GntR family transcriptional regulator [Microbacterium fandaimingii]
MGSFPKSQPLFVSLARQLRDRIDSSEWPTGDRLPTERTLAASYAVGLNTVRRAIRTLADDGIVISRQGSGTFVADRALPRMRTAIGVVVPSTSYYFPPLLQGISQVADAAGVDIHIRSSDYDDALEMQWVHELLSTGVTGLLIAPTLHTSDPSARLESLRRLQVPVILIERLPPSSAPDDVLSSISTDVVAGGYGAVRHLTERRRRRIGFLGRSDTATATSVWEGYRRAMDDFGLEIMDDAVMRLRAWDDAAFEEFTQRAQHHRLDALFCLGDREAIELLPRLQKAGLSVPKDLAIVTYDDEEAALAEVPLSAVSPPKTEIGRLAASTLLRQIDGAARADVRTLLRPRVLVRASSGS